MTTQTGNNGDTLKRELLEVIAFIYRRIKHDNCTKEEMSSAMEMLAEHVKIWASPKDLAIFYGQSESNVHNVLSRHYIPEEETRHVNREYNMNFFAKIKPKSWRRKSHK